MFANCSLYQGPITRWANKGQGGLEANAHLQSIQTQQNSTIIVFSCLLNF